VKILVTGGDRPLGLLLARGLSPKHSIRLYGLSENSSVGDFDLIRLDLRDEAAVRDAVQGVDAIIHASEFEIDSPRDAAAEADALERASLGAYRLCLAAREFGVERIVVVSTLRLFDSHPKDYLIDELWAPQPMPDPVQLAPWLTEQVVREFAFEGGVRAICLRFRPIGGDPETQTREADALEAVEKALARPFRTPGRRWDVYHVASAERYVLRNARLELGFVGKGRN
jgi:nucleoside-diphosphate-sugar epimerase